eukprot:1187990-Prorocentrum_minimum.AAC.1
MAKLSARRCRVVKRQFRSQAEREGFSSYQQARRRSAVPCGGGVRFLVSDDWPAAEYIPDHARLSFAGREGGFESHAFGLREEAVFLQPCNAAGGHYALVKPLSHWRIQFSDQLFADDLDAGRFGCRAGTCDARRVSATTSERQREEACVSGARVSDCFDMLLGVPDQVQAGASKHCTLPPLFSDGRNSPTIIRGHEASGSLTSLWMILAASDREYWAGAQCTG